MSALAFVRSGLDDLRAQGLFREPRDAAYRRKVRDRALGEGFPFVDACSNDYLGYGQEGVSRETLLRCSATPAGARASRLVHGTAPAQDDLERALAAWVGLPSALLFSSGYAANVGLLSALAEPGDLIVSDQLNHASIVDGCRLSRATVRVIPHLDVDAAAHALRSTPARRRFLVTESYFSMDADTPDLPALRALCSATDTALILDEAHALGVFGPTGSGLAAAHATRPDILLGTLGKALAAQGAFVATDTATRAWLWNRARSFIFSTGFSPLLACLAHLNLRRARTDDQARTRLHANAQTLAATLRQAGFHLPPAAHGPILPLILGSNHDALAAADHLATHGILAQAFRPPTVPPNTARLRLTLHAALSQHDLHHLAQTLLQTCPASSS